MTSSSGDAASMPPAADEYRRRLKRLHDASARLARHDGHFSTARALTALAAVVIGYITWSSAAAWWLLAPGAVFVALVVLHDWLLRKRNTVIRTIAFYDRGVARLEDRWAGTGQTGERFADENHLYADDLDLFGRGSLFELLSAARTRAGEETLADWLRKPATADVIAARRLAVEELTTALDFRETLALSGADVRAAVHTDSLMAWAERPSALGAPWLRIAAAILTIAVIGTGAYWFSTGNFLPFIAVVLAEALYYVPQNARIMRVLLSAEAPARDLDVLAHILEALEQSQYMSPRLMELRNSLNTGGVQASKAIRRLSWLIQLLDWQRNVLFAPIAAVLLWIVHLAWAIEAWRGLHGKHVRTWLRVVGEFEALASIAAYRYEHPNHVWADVVDGPALFDATSLAHPLLPAAQAVSNDVRLSSDSPLLILSGSNMAGKSTLLRTIGINAVLAFAGVPVSARRLRLTPFVVGATLRIEDSLQKGRSRFFAEIVRIRALADLASGTPPLLFLLDELFHGTNSHDRLIGGTGVLRSLLARGAVGLVTTHDLALTAMAEQLTPKAVNVHLADDFEGGELRFDYRLRSGPVTHSNALALMRIVGLSVD